jgi:hypothetical protein
LVIFGEGIGAKMSDYPMHCAPRCGATTRRKTPCRAPAIRGKARCRMHGGKSTGRPVIHGRYKKETIQKKREWRAVLRELRKMIERTR